MCCILKRPDLHICAAEQREKCVSADSSLRILKLHSQRHSLSLSLLVCLTPGNPFPESQRSPGAPVRRPSRGSVQLTITCSLRGGPARAFLADICKRVCVRVQTNERASRLQGGRRGEKKMTSPTHRRMQMEIAECKC